MLRRSQKTRHSRDEEVSENRSWVVLALAAGVDSGQNRGNSANGIRCFRKEKGHQDKAPIALGNSAMNQANDTNYVMKSEKQCFLTSLVLQDRRDGIVPHDSEEVDAEIHRRTAEQ